MQSNTRNLNEMAKCESSTCPYTHPHSLDPAELRPNQPSSYVFACSQGVLATALHFPIIPFLFFLSVSYHFIPGQRVLHSFTAMAGALRGTAFVAVLSAVLLSFRELNVTALNVVTYANGVETAAASLTEAEDAHKGRGVAGTAADGTVPLVARVANMVERKNSRVTIALLVTAFVLASSIALVLKLRGTPKFVSVDGGVVYTPSVVRVLNYTLNIYLEMCQPFHMRIV